MRVLVLLEHENGFVRSGSLRALGFAQQLAGADNAAGLLLGANLGDVSTHASRYAQIYAADHACLEAPIAERYAPIIAEIVGQDGFDYLVAASTGFAKDILGRAAGLLGGIMASDVIAHEAQAETLVVKRPMLAGAVVATLELLGQPATITIRPSAYPPATIRDEPWPIQNWPIDPAKLPMRTEREAVVARPAARPDLTEARVVVSGGRAFKSEAEFEQYVGALADQLGGAAGCTRALVDAGIVPNELQVGQTGKVVAPALYIALGVSGAVHHVAGMRNSRVVVAINTDPQAPIFNFANYALVADVREAVPKLIQALKTHAEQ